MQDRSCLNKLIIIEHPEISHLVGMTQFRLAQFLCTWYLVRPRNGRLCPMSLHCYRRSSVRQINNGVDVESLISPFMLPASHCHGVSTDKGIPRRRRVYNFDFLGRNQFGFLTLSKPLCCLIDDALVVVSHVMIKNHELAAYIRTQSNYNIPNPPVDKYGCNFVPVIQTPNVRNAGENRGFSLVHNQMAQPLIRFLRKRRRRRRIQYPLNTLLPRNLKIMQNLNPSAITIS